MGHYRLVKDLAFFLLTLYRGLKRILTHALVDKSQLVNWSQHEERGQNKLDGKAGSEY